MALPQPVMVSVSEAPFIAVVRPVIAVRFMLAATAPAGPGCCAGFAPPGGPGPPAGFVLPGDPAEPAILPRMLSRVGTIMHA